MFFNIITAKIFIFVIKQDNEFIDSIWHNLPCNLISSGRPNIHSLMQSMLIKSDNQRTLNPTVLFDVVFVSTSVFKITVFDDLTI